MLELPEWFYAVRTFRDHGTTTPIAKLLLPLEDTLNQETRRLFKGGDKEVGKEHSEQAKQVKHSIHSLERYAFAYESGLPLELGKASGSLISSIQKLPAIDSIGLPPLVTELIGTITDAAEKSAFVEPPSKRWELERDRRFR